MHEFSVTETLFNQVLAQAHTAGAERVTDVYLVLGQLDHAVESSLQFYWDMLSYGTLAAGARLHVRRVPAVFRCERCGHQYTPENELPGCPHCHSLSIRLVSGDEFYLEALEIVPAGEPEGEPPEREGRPR
jgi:hydrogenase nickel incorporation protein HypA/HybF